ncbi:MAG: tyrosine--tRNA ligase [Candidatus Parcubacteria bacterium]|nr:tyrosine--tRNA ligase [Candidatus Parcubacteria bacterium]
MAKVITDEKLIEEILTRGVELIYPDKESLKKVLMSGKKLRIYDGFDPTGPTLHLGHGNQLRKLAQFQKLGHEVIFLIGDFTARIGDPSGKLSTRKQLSKKEVLANLKNYKKQASTILDFTGKNAAKVLFNSKWQSKLKFEDVLNLASKVTVQRMVERDMFEKRIEEGKPIYVHEFMYPLLQGYDCVAMDVDMEIGGSDQTFNMLVGRDLMKDLKKKEKFVLTIKLLTDPTGKKMGKTEGNMITLDDSAQEMFGKVMSWSDQMIAIGFEICTDLPMSEIEDMKKKMKEGANPRDFKRQLAREIVKIYRNEKAANEAQENFIKVFSNKEAPEEVKSYKVSAKGGSASGGKSKKLLEILEETGLVSSKSEARRVIEQGGVKIDNEIVKDVNFNLTSGEHLIQKGKRFFARVIVK